MNPLFVLKIVSALAPHIGQLVADVEAEIKTVGSAEAVSQKAKDSVNNVTDILKTLVSVL